MKLLRLFLFAAVGVGSLTSCGTSSSNPITVQTLDRPTDLAFGCYGAMRIVGDDGVQATDPIEYQPHPLGSCRTRTGPLVTDPLSDDPDNAPAGQEDLEGTVLGPSMTWYGFALQPVAGSVAIIRARVKGDGAGYPSAGEIAVLDGDELSPGMNSVSVGSQPVAIATAPSGCHLLTANAGSCDLSVIDVDRVIERPAGEPLVRKQALTTASGAPLLARPGAMVVDQREAEIGTVCPEAPDGLLYIAYPDCNAVAVIDAATGGAVASVRFDDQGNATLSDGDLDCPAQCGTPESLPTGARPVALDIVSDTTAGLRRLAIGLEGHPVVTVVDLDDDWMPTTVRQVELDGEIGIVDIAISKQLGMTGDSGRLNDDSPLAIPAEYVYAVATDGTVRVAEVGSQYFECDTQIDPRYLREVTITEDLLCIPVGQPLGETTPPRRPGAIGPGIQLPGDNIALQVAITTAGIDREDAVQEVSPVATVGHFAFIGGSSGTIFTVNIDDDVYVDRYDRTEPFASQLPLAMSHQLRDGVADRAATGVGPNGTLETDEPPDCTSNGPTGTGGPPRINEPPTLTTQDSQIDRTKVFMMPAVRQLSCSQTDDDGEVEETAVPELGWASPPEVRSAQFPDWRAISFDERWSAVWEGALSLDTSGVAVDGPQVRGGQLAVDDGEIRVLDSARPFCAAGVEPYDYVVLRGCDPERGSSQCSLGETCYVHPDSTVGTGSCLPSDQADELGAVCRDFLLSVRQYAVQEATAGELVLSERRRVLRTTPVDGCTSAAQCDELAAYADTLPRDQNPQNALRTWACEPDPSRDPSIDRCVMTCEDSTQCDDGTTCSDGYCVEGPIPSARCLPGLQRYELHGTDAFVVIGTDTGYLHSIVEGEDGTCVEDESVNSLLTGRIPLTAPDCEGDELTGLAVNPCRTTVEHTNTVPNYTDLDTCTMGDADADPPEPELVIVTEPVEAIRFSNPAFTFHLIDATYPGDLQCPHDRMGDRAGIPTVYPGYSISMRVIDGFLAQDAGSPVVFPANLVRSPDGVVWIVDEGDIIPSADVSANTRGQILRVDPDSISSAAYVR